ncbi:MAG: hypothetical protein EBR30_06545 [Cytophagia bacterium]|nr:hypothetical protein [Cytophagia bacterium]
MLRFFKNYYPYFPIAGFALYLIVFTLAALQYPGGSFNLPKATGYSFFHNFLCDVMDPVTKGGVFNPARMLAVVSHIILSLTMISFFYMLPEIFENRNRNFFMIRYFGMFTMTVFMLMATSYHDLIVTFTGVLGTLALIPFFIELRNYTDKRLIQLASLCFFMSIVVFFIFETKIGFYYLPFLQKITFVLDAWWVIWVSLIVMRKRKKLAYATSV